MGCAISKSGDENPLGILPFMRRVHDLRRTKTDLSRRGRKDSIVSTTELLRPEELDIDYYDTAATEISAEKDENKGKRNEANNDSSEKVENDEVERRRIGFGRGVAVEEDLPGSPSFRFYCTDAVRESDKEGSVQDSKPDALNRIEERELLEEKEGHNESLLSGEGSEPKVIKKEKGRKFMTLPKANFLNVRGCYNMNSSKLAAEEGTRMLSDKAT